MASKIFRWMFKCFARYGIDGDLSQGSRTAVLNFRIHFPSMRIIVKTYPEIPPTPGNPGLDKDRDQRAEFPSEVRSFTRSS